MGDFWVHVLFPIWQTHGFFTYEKNLTWKLSLTGSCYIVIVSVSYFSKSHTFLRALTMRVFSLHSHCAVRHTEESKECIWNRSINFKTFSLDEKKFKTFWDLFPNMQRLTWRPYFCVIYFTNLDKECAEFQYQCLFFGLNLSHISFLIANADTYNGWHFSEIQSKNVCFRGNPLQLDTWITR